MVRLENHVACVQVDLQCANGLQRLPGRDGLGETKHAWSVPRSRSRTSGLTIETNLERDGIQTADGYFEAVRQ